MHTTQGQAAFGHNVQAIITYSYMVKTFRNRYRWTRLFNARHTHLLQNCVSSESPRRRRNGGGPGVGCVRMPVGTYLYLHAVGAGNPVAVPGLAR
jgi:hypothetical protein